MQLTCIFTKLLPDFNPCGRGGGCRRHPLFSCVPYETTKRVSRWQHVYSVGQRRAGLLCHLYRNAGPKHCHHCQTSRDQSPVDPFYAWCNMLLTGMHHSPVVSILLLFPQILPYSPSPPPSPSL